MPPVVQLENVLCLRDDLALRSCAHHVGFSSLRDAWPHATHNESKQIPRDLRLRQKQRGTVARGPQASSVSFEPTSLQK